MAQPRAANQSYLSIKQNGYDFVVATTQASINSGLKLFLSEDKQPVVHACFLVDAKGNPTELISLEDLLERTNGVSPFDIPAGTPYSDPRITALTAERFNVSIKMRMGLPPGIQPKNLPDVVQFRDAANNVVFRLLCSEMTIIQNSPPSGWGSPGQWDVLSQPSGQAWYFETFVDLVMANLDKNLDNSDYLKEHPDVREQLRRQLENLSGTAFSLQQLLLDLSSAVLQTVPTIQGVEKGSNAEFVLQRYFINIYSDAAKQYGWPLLSVTAVSQSPDPSQLVLTSFERQVTKYKPPTSSTENANTLDHVCVINNRAQPAKYDFDWNWVELSEIDQLSGAISINRNTMGTYLMNQLLPVISTACLKVECSVDASWYFEVKYWVGITPRQNPTATITQTGPNVIRIEHSSSAYDEDQEAAIYGALSLKHSYTCDVKFEGTHITVVQKAVVNLFIQYLNTSDQLNVYDVTITDTYDLSVDQAGSMRISRTSQDKNDQSQDPNNSGIVNWFTGINDMVNNIKGFISGIADARLSDAPFNSVPNFIFPGSQVFTYTSSRFSTHEDLVCGLTYVDPRQPHARNPMDTGLGLGITYSSELMQNYVQGEIVSPTGKFEALQSDNLNGHALLFAIDSNGVFNVVEEQSGQTSTGWKVADLSTNAMQRYFSSDGSASVSTFGVGQSALDGTIGLAIGVQSGGSDYLLISLGNSCSDLSWFSYPFWTLIPFDDPDFNSQPIKVADVLFAETSSNEQYLVVDIDCNARQRTKDIVRYHIDVSKSTGRYWVKHDLPIDIESGNYQSCIGRTANGYVDGVYTAGTSGGAPQLIYQPIINAFGSGPPLPSRFNLPGGKLPSAIATVRNTDKSQAKLYASTDLYTIGGSTLYRFAADDQHDNAVGKALLTNSVFSGTDTLRAMMSDGVTTLWGKNASNEVFYASCLSDKVNDADSWSAPVPILTGIERISAYLNRMNGGNTIFASGGGKLIKVTQATNTATKAWRPQEITLAATPKQKLISFKSYTTTINLVGKDGLPLADSKLSIWANSQTPVYINGLYYVLGSTAIDIPTDASGAITVVEVTEDMNAAILSVSIPRDSLTTVINPMDTAFDKLAKLNSVKSLREASYPANTVAGGVVGSVESEPLVDPSIGQRDLDALASNMSQLKKVYDKCSPSSLTKKLYYSEDGPHVVPATYFRDEHGLRGIGDDIAMAAGDLFRWLKSGIAAIIEIVEDTLSGAWHFVAKIAGKVYRAVLDAADAVMGAIEWVFGAIKTAIEDIIRFVEFLFQWDDIKRTKNVLHNVVELYLKHQVSQIDDARTAFDAKIDQVGDTLSKWGNLTDWSSLGDVAEKPASGSSENPANGQTSGSLLFANHFRNQAGAVEIKSVLPTYHADAEDLIDILLDSISEEGEVLSGVYGELQQVASKFGSWNVEEIIRALAAILAKGLLSSVKVVVDALFRVLASLASSALDLLDAKLHVPIISDILNAIGIPDISILDLFTWIAAVGYTVVYKIAEEKPPFPDSSEIKAIIAAESWDQLTAVFHNQSVADDNEKSEGPVTYGSFTELQKIFYIAGHATAGFTLFVTNFLSAFEAEAMTGDNPFSILSAVAGITIAGTQAAADLLAPRYPIENEAVSAVSTATTVAGVVNKVVFSGPVQKKMAVTSSKFQGLAVNDGRATSSIIDSILVIPALFVTGWHFYELSEKSAGKERSAAIIGEVSRLSAYASRISYAVAVNDKDPSSKQIPIIAMAASNVVGSGLQTAAALIVD